MQKKKILLVLPKLANNPYTNNRYTRRLTGFKSSFINCQLPTLAALTPKEFDVTLADENVQALPLNQDFDLVGITGFSTEIIRAKEIADHFRSRNIPVICGGPSVSTGPQRWRTFSDVLMIGEAEKTYPQFLQDFLSGRYKKEYVNKEHFDLSIVPIPRYELVPRQTLKYYSGGIVQMSRGCPYDCEFCNAIVYVGRQMRYKPVDKILAEIEALYRLGIQLILIGDDNFAAGRRRAKNILRHIIDWKKKNKASINFITLVSIETASDDELLDLFYKAGVNRIFIGIETPNENSLKETGKQQNLRESLFEDINKFKKRGIFIHAGSMVGFDSDDKTIFRKQFEFFQKAGIPNIHTLPIQALDQTKLKARMIEEGRYRDWMEGMEQVKVPSFLSFHTIVPKQMTIEELRNGIFWLIRKLYDYDNYLERVENYFKSYTGAARGRFKMAEESPVSFARSFQMAFNIAKFLLFKADSEERVFFIKMLRSAMRSTHPQRMVIAIFSFLYAINVRYAVGELCPDIAQLPDIY